VSLDQGVSIVENLTTKKPKNQQLGHLFMFQLLLHFYQM